MSAFHTDTAGPGARGAISDLAEIDRQVVELDARAAGIAMDGIAALFAQHDWAWTDLRVDWSDQMPADYLVAIDLVAPDGTARECGELENDLDLLVRALTKGNRSVWGRYAVDRPIDAPGPPRGTIDRLSIRQWADSRDSTVDSTDGRSQWRVGFYVEVEAAAYHSTEAPIVAEAACGWPGSWSPPHEPVGTEGVLDSRRVTARILRSQALMVKEAPNDG